MADGKRAQETRGLPPTSSRRTLRPTQGLLIALAGPDGGRRFFVRAPRVRLGTESDNDIVLTDDTVSRHHALIEERPDGFLVQDLGSRNGTFIDDVPVKQAMLPPGATLRLGSTLMRFEPPSERVELTASARDEFGGIRGRSAKMRELFGLLERVAPTDLNVLVTGETGTGKEVFARAIHAESKRAKRPYTVFDCSAVSRDLMESALFGHRDGAFTGATGSRKGACLSAAGGTLFIDEVGELELALQPKLLRLLERREVQPLGSDHVETVDVRVIAATHRDLRAMVRKGQFRQDLYYRLSVVEVNLPPLRERPEDIPALLEHMLEACGAADRRLSPEALDRLVRARWPGNVRELKNTLERTVAMTAANPIGPDDLKLEQDIAAPSASAGGGSAGERTLDDVEREAISATLARTGGNRTHAARVLGISRKTLLDKIKKYELED